MIHPELANPLPPVTIGECGTNDSIIYATALLCLAVVVAVGYGLWRVMR